MRKTRIGVVAGAIALATAFSALPAGATGSVAGVDQTTREVGHGLASCTAWLGRTTPQMQSEIYKPVPGKGVVVGQALWFQGSQTAMATQLAAGQTPAQIIPASRAIHPGVQYLVASLSAPAAAHTGLNASGFPVRAPGGVPNEDDVKQNQVTTGALNNRFEGVAAGNTLLSTTMVRQMGAGLEAPTVDIVTELEKVLAFDIPPAEEAQLRANGGDLAERLMFSLAAGFDDANATPGEGDSRCVNGTASYGPIKRSSSQGWLRVDRPDGTQAMNLRFESDHQFDAVRELANMYYLCQLGRISCTSDIATYAVTKPISGKSLVLTAPNGGKLQTFSYESADPHFKSVTIDPRRDQVAIRFHTGTQAAQYMKLPASGWQLVSATGAPVWSYTKPAGDTGPINTAELNTQTGLFKASGTQGGFTGTVAVANPYVDVLLGYDRYCSYGGQLIKWTQNKYAEFKNMPRFNKCYENI